jgi:hypothetical protein
MTTLDSTRALTAGALSADLLELAAHLATQNPLPANLAQDVAPLTATLLKRREARTTPARPTV